MVARDLFSLVRRFRDNREVNSLHSYNALVRVLKDQCSVTEEQDDQPAGVEVKSPKEVSSASLQNPSGNVNRKLTTCDNPILTTPEHV
jgi:hypothetical protein